MDFDLVALGSLFLDGRVTSVNENYVAGSTINISDAPPDLGGRIFRYWLPLFASTFVRRTALCA